MSDKRRTFDSLKVRNYRLYWSVQLVSQLGSWMRLIAVSWLVLTELGGRGTAVGFLTAAQFLPTLLLGPWAGVLTDRRSPLTFLRITQVVMVAIDTTLALLVATGHIELWMVFGLVGAAGTVTAFDNPARQAIVSELVDDAQVPNAVALNSMGFNAARIVGPAIAGILIQTAGTPICFWVDAASYLVALAGFTLIDHDRMFPRSRAARAKGQIREGLRYAMSEPVLRAALLTMAVVGTLSINFTTLVPLLSRYFTNSAGTFGLFSTAMGVGSLIGGVIVARRTTPTLNQLTLASFSLGVAMSAVAAAPGFAVAAVALSATGICMMTFLSTTNSLLQLNARPDLRGRVLALYLVLVAGTSPIGAPIIGWIAQNHGVRTSVAVGAVGALLGAAVTRLPSLATPRQELATTVSN